MVETTRLDALELEEARQARSELEARQTELILSLDEAKLNVKDREAKLKDSDARVLNAEQRARVSRELMEHMKGQRDEALAKSQANEKKFDELFEKLGEVQLANVRGSSRISELESDA